MNGILEQVCDIILWAKNELKYDKHHLLTLSPNPVFYFLQDKLSSKNDLKSWLNYIKKQGVTDIKLCTSTEENNEINLLCPERQKISIICIFKDYITEFVPQWNYSSKEWNVTYTEKSYNKTNIPIYKNNIEDFKSILNKIVDYYTKINPSRQYYAPVNSFIEIIDKISEEDTLQNNKLYQAASMADSLFYGMGGWFDGLYTKEEKELAKEMYKQQKLALLYCINEVL